MTYNFDSFPDRKITESVKWKEYDPDVLPMWVADMDFMSPEPVIRALRERVEHGVFGYPMESKELSRIIVDWVQKRHNWKISPEDIMLIPGVITGFNLVSHTVARPGENVIIQTPAYPPFLSVSKNVELGQCDCELIRDSSGQYMIDYDSFERAITPETRLFILCNPHNPTGRVFRKDELEKLAEICLRHNVLICSDEIHSDLIYKNNKHLPIASLSPEISKNAVTLIAPSKTFNIAGLAGSVGIIQNHELREKMCSSGKGLLGWVNLLGLTAMRAAYQEGEPWLEELLVYLEGNRDYMVDYLKTKMPTIKMGKPEGTYLAWLDCREAGIVGKPHEFFLKHARVAVNDGARFGCVGEGFVRMNFGCPRSMLKESLDRMSNALKEAA